ncbi:g6494 [Coccomyxa viridis]|uniref:G6494 protein n=1 Tax=Coccomyxa viridis TaxID=1274662 RepID=A0ABP1FVH8_9CHLO
MKSSTAWCMTGHGKSADRTSSVVTYRLSCQVVIKGGAMASALLKAHNLATFNSAAPVLRQKPRSSSVSVFAASTLSKTEKQAKRQPRDENVGLDSKKAFYVDHTCIDCDTCRWIAPEFFGRENEQSAMIRQPETEAERVQSFQALVSCPTYSIHAKDHAELKEAVAKYPEPVEGAQGVFYCGYNSERSFGGSAWLIQREAGNVLVDSPRFDPKLVKNIKALGGIKYIFLTHRDDVADHAQWAEEFGAERIIHADECNSQQGTDKCEIKLEGEEPWDFPGAPDDLEIIHTPGHTYGHIILLHKPSKTLFTGDHLAFTREPAGVFTVHKAYNWYSVPKQVESVRKLLPYDFVNICPGHGRPGHLKDAAHKEELINELLDSEGAL